MLLTTSGWFRSSGAFPVGCFGNKTLIIHLFLGSWIDKCKGGVYTQAYWSTQPELGLLLLPLE